MAKASLSTDQIIAELEAFEAGDFDFENEGKLDPLMDALKRKKDRARAIDAMLGIFERFPEADLGQPGPLVHMLEQISAAEPEVSEQKLVEAIQRKPTFYTVWMVNRERNAAKTPAETRKWTELLKGVLKHKKPGPEAKQAAKEFLAEDDE